MDLGDLWNSNAGQNSLNPWPEPMAEDSQDYGDVTEATEIVDQRPDTPRPLFSDEPNVSNLRPFLSEIPNLGDPALIPQQPPSEDRDRQEAFTRAWAATQFNKNEDGMQKMAPRLMDPSEMDSTRNFELYRLHSATFELNEGDTLVIIDYPVIQKAALNQADCNGILFRSQQFRVHSTRLLNTNSPKFAEMFGPTYQFRILRRRKLVNKLPIEIRYVLDLTPPSEGDELVFQMTELSLTPGIIKWWSSSMLHEVDSWLVCGHDDICKCDRSSLPRSPTNAVLADQSPTETSPVLATPSLATWTYNGLKDQLPLQPEKLIQMKARQDYQLYETPEFRNIPDYCPIRHRNGIIRLLMMIEGKPAIFDSAPRVWTMVKLSKMFDCVSVVRDRIAQWIMHGPNTRFIEVLPEEAFQLAFDLQLPEIAQASFRILVNELALKEADTKEPNKATAHITPFGRKIGDLPDELSNLVQHSARAFLERISNLHKTLQNPDMFDFSNIPQWHRLRTIEQLLVSQTGPTAEIALSKLRTFMAALVYEVTHMVEMETTGEPRDYDNVNVSIDQDRATYTDIMHYERIGYLMRRMNPVQRLMCATTYSDMGISVESDLYLRKRTKYPDAKGARYSRLSEIAGDALQKVIDGNPVLMYSDAWQDCFDLLNPNQFIGNIRQVRSPLVNLREFELNVKTMLYPISLSWVRHDIEPPLNITRHLLLTLNIDEMKFLPLWAGGCDDGTGGVFETQIPPAEMGPNGPGPAFHTGCTIPSQPSSVAGSMIEDLAEMRLRGTNTAASIDVNDSISTVYHPGRVIADDVSIASEAFTVGESDYQTAKFAVPVDGQSISSAVDMLVETAESDAQSTMADHDSTAEPGEDSDFWNDSDSDDSIVLIDM